MTNSLRIRTATALLLGVAGIAALHAAPATAHDSGTILVPRQYPGHPAMVVDGTCENEYDRASNKRPVVYTPRLNLGSATVATLTTSTDLYVCVKGLTQKLPGATSTPDYMALAFDPQHNGGGSPDDRDLLFTADESGQLREWHGNGTGFAPIAGRSGWSAAVQSGGEITWSVEFRISLTKIGASPGGVVGFQARHTSVFEHNDSYSWPTSSVNREPRTWGDLFFLRAPTTTPGPMRLDAGRVDHGLPWDLSQGANEPYQLVERKDAYLSGQLATSGAITQLTTAECLVQRTGPGSPGPLRVVDHQPFTTPRVTSSPSGQIQRPGAVECWLPGSVLDRPGTYQFSVRAQMAGGELQTIPVATRQVMPTRSVRLMIYRWAFPPGHAENRSWDDVLNASAEGAMADLNRVLPIPSGVGPFAFTSTAGRSAPGLRYFFAPSVYQCTVQDGETMDDAVGRCDATTRNLGDLTRMIYDLQSSLLDFVDGQHRDRIDLQEVFVSTPQSGGGQSCWGDSRSAGSGLDSLPTGQSHFVPIQESEHCWGELDPSSPHSDRDNTSHSYNEFPAFSAPLANTLTRELMTRPRGVMSPFFGIESHNTFTNEGHEFNHLRRTLVTLPNPSGGPAPSARTGGRSPAPRAGHTQLQLALLIDRADNVTVQSSRRVLDSTLPQTAAPKSPYRLEFRDADGKALSARPFAVLAVGEHDKIPVTGVVLNVNVPAGSTKVEVTKAGTPLLQQELTPIAPKIGEVQSDPGKGEQLDLSWTASDPDSPELQASIYFQQHPDAPMSLIAAGVPGSSYAFDTSSAPGTTDGVITVEVSDGFRTSTAKVDGVQVGDKAPWASIVGPDDGGSYVEGQPVTLVGTAYNPNSMSPLDDSALSWSSDVDGDLGKGGSVTTALSPGTHTITLQAKSPQGLTDTASVVIEVLGDKDGNTLPDGWEKGHDCLSSPVDAADDADADTLSNGSEYLWQTDPCSADTDGDGWDDGTETTLGGDPGNKSSRPSEDLVYFSAEPLNLGSCPSPKTGAIRIQTESAKTPWTASSDSSFLKVTRRGTGPGTVRVTVDCSRLDGKTSAVGRVGIMARSGAFREVVVRVHG